MSAAASLLPDLHKVRGRQFPILVAACALAIAPFAASAQSSLPDPALTPGAINPAVTQDDIQSTICVRGWTRTVRPPERYTYRLKRQQIRAYGYAIAGSATTRKTTSFRSTSAEHRTTRATYGPSCAIPQTAGPRTRKTNTLRDSQISIVRWLRLLSYGLVALVMIEVGRTSLAQVFDAFATAHKAMTLELNTATI